MSESITIRFKAIAKSPLISCLTSDGERFTISAEQVRGKLGAQLALLQQRASWLDEPTRSRPNVLTQGAVTRCEYVKGFVATSTREAREAAVAKRRRPDLSLEDLGL